MSARRERAAQAAVAHTLQVKAEISALYGLIADAETGVRGYLLTRHPESLKVVQEAGVPLQSQYRRLADLVSDNPVQKNHLQRITEHARNRPLDALLDFAKSSPVTTPPPLDLLARSRATMAGLRQELRSMQAEEDARLVAREIGRAHV